MSPAGYRQSVAAVGDILPAPVAARVRERAKSHDSCAIIGWYAGC